MATKGPALYNLEPFYQAGIDPKSGLPLKFDNQKEGWRKEAIKKSLRIIDE